MRPRTLATALAILLPAPVAAADLPGDPVAGARLAQSLCARCHAIEPDELSPAYPAPALVEYARDPSVTEMSLRAFLLTPHALMPDIRLDARETDDVVAYLLSRKQR